jgi:hypothetical protein
MPPKKLVGEPRFFRCSHRCYRSQTYLADVLVRLVNLWPNNRRDELLPRISVATREQKQRAA